ncbi:MAG: ribosome recycling factor, partial [Epsilonproteobacteria bacterium]|nr:ribosome recycling factor [Campylobacterota bacterium]
MELNEIYEYAKDHMQKSLDVLKKDFSTLRTGRVTTAVVENIKVEYYGTPTPLNQTASIVA